MDEKIDILQESLSKLPEVVQDCIRSKDWQMRIAEIVTKYSLNTNQNANLQYEILFVIVGFESIDDLVNNIKKELNISSLLAEQLVNDIKDRILSWINKVYESKNPKQKTEEVKPVNENEPKNIIEKTVLEAQNDIPEVRPRITPMIEPGEKVHTIKPFTVTSNIVNKESPSQNKTSEFVQKPISVPRYTAETLEENVPEPIVPIVKKYVVDPYREPLE
jgi:hypothetical protein